MHKPCQITDSLLMICPARLGFNEQTAASNAFQKRIEELFDAGILSSDIETVEVVGGGVCCMLAEIFCAKR